MMLSLIEVKCFKDLIVTGVNGAEYVALKSGNTYDAHDSGDKITVQSDKKKFEFLKSDFPTSHLGVV